ncbi:hypothetical protein E4U43_002346 [Claviceps pusilla]|uniref:A-kinase anchor protein 7-like phosphoesterase domain-containing protein n=1 Tax=Claviceps pusilla TaxID=123648 RepID=A0A9P7SYF9_9HYPO|nr:hypothetical protein E4U43_002346 [Claviceps pusilla]
MPLKPSPPTHFLSLQLASAHLSRSLAAFRADVTSPDGFAIPGEAIRPPGTLHMTLGVMSLKQDFSRQDAIALLRQLQPRAILSDRHPRRPPSRDDPKTPPPTAGYAISLRGLHSMGGPPSKTGVLYASPTDTEGILHPFCEELRRPFRDKGLIVEQRPLVLHVTVLNTIYVRHRRRDREEDTESGEAMRGGRRRRERLMLDARALLDRYDGYAWVEDMPVTSLALCRMGARKVDGVDGGDEVYDVEGEVEI